MNTIINRYAHPKFSGEQKDEKNIVIKYCLHKFTKIQPEYDAFYQDTAAQRNQVAGKVFHFIEVSKN